MRLADGKIEGADKSEAGQEEAERKKFWSIDPAASYRWS